jgi:hypothetical protein
MHPELMRDLMIQSAAETRARAHEARLARTARKLERARRDLAEASRTFAVPEIPDYVDTMFGESGQAPTQDGAPGRRAA